MPHTSTSFKNKGEVPTVAEYIAGILQFAFGSQLQD